MVKYVDEDTVQFHTKIAYFDYKDQDPIAILGSANFTRRNLYDYILETDVKLIMQKDSVIHQEKSFLLRRVWKIREKLGLCTWKSKCNIELT
ncbi:MAG: hypothetical protein Q4G11_04050 [Gallicola sp.]|nr:hypothetical protein [Gallicola sp.]